MADMTINGKSFKQILQRHEWKFAHYLLASADS